MINHMNHVPELIYNNFAWFSYISNLHEKDRKQKEEQEKEWREKIKNRKR